MEISFKFVFGLLIVLASSQQPIVNQLEHPTGDTFNITCDASRFVNLRSGNEISSVSLLRQVSTQTNFENIASYWPSAKDTHKIENNLPNQWQAYSTGGEEKINRYTIRIVVTVVDFQCEDAGLYRCTINLPSPFYETSTTPVNITAKIAITQKDISMSPKNKAIGEDQHSSVNLVGEEITMNCSFTGPANLQAVWKRKVSDNEKDYPYANNIRSSSGVPSVISGCTIYGYTSELKFKLEERDNKVMYICVVMEDNNERSRKMFTIGIFSTTDPTIVNPSSRTNSAGSSVGIIVIFVLLFLVIAVVLIYFFVIQKKKPIESSEADTSKKIEPTEVY